MTIKKIKKKLRPSEEGGLFHNSRGDVRRLAKVLNEVVDKVNELVDAKITWKSSRGFGKRENMTQAAQCASL